MAIRKLKNGGRRKALFGSEEGAILAAAGINVAGTMAASAIGASATKKAAQDQAKATIQSAQKQAQAIKDQSAKSKELQQESQEFIKEQNAENRELQKDIQLQLQMLTGQQNVNDRLEASKIQVKNGGSTKRKLRLVGKYPFLLRGSENMPFVVTDGGTVIPIGQTPEGYDMYEILGNDHEHYHKARGGKNKTGVGIKFADGNVVEGEGNQNSNQGEIMVNTPDNAYFISKHSIAGFNPAKMTLGGMHPLQAYAIQEQLKAANGISDDGKHNSSPVEKKLLGGEPNYVIDMYNQVGPQMGVDTVGDTTVGVVTATQDDKSKLKFGGKKRCLRLGGRAKAAIGRDVINKWWAGLDNQTRNNVNMAAAGIGNPTVTGRTSSSNTGNASSSNTGGTSRPVTPSMFEHQPSGTNGNTRGSMTTTTRGGGFGGWINRNADLVGAGIGALGNVGGALITSGANRSAARTIADAQNQAAGIMRDAYNSLTGIDMNSIRREDFAAAHAMPALQAPVSFAAGQNALVNRSLQRTLANAGRYSASGAAAQRRMAEAEVNAQDARNQIYSADQRQMQEIRQGNAERVTQAAMKNAELDTQANRDYTGAYLNLLQYNNDINNQKILGAAGAMSEGAINAANAIGQAQTSNAAAWASALTGSSQGFANSLSNMIARRNDLAKVMLGASGDSQASYYANPRLASDREANIEYNRLLSQYNIIKNSKKDEDKAAIASLKRRINNIATGRGFQTV